MLVGFFYSLLLKIPYPVAYWINVGIFMDKVWLWGGKNFLFSLQFF